QFCISDQQTAREIFFTTHIGQAHLAAFEQKCQSLVIQAEQLQDRRVKVVDVDALLAGAESELVSRADGPSALDAAAGQPGREAVRIVVASRAFVGVTTVGNRGASKLAAPNDQRAVKQTARFQIL